MLDTIAAGAQNEAQIPDKSHLKLWCQDRNKKGSGPLYVNLIQIRYKIRMNVIELCYLLLGAPSLLIKNIMVENDQIHITVTSTQKQGCCPACNERSISQHSTYSRHPSDLPWASVPVFLHIAVKRFFCQNSACPKKTFAERFPNLVDWYQRRTKRVQEKQQQLSTNTSARAAEMLLKDHKLGLSNTSINRLLRRLPDPQTAPVRVLGVDDWAKRKGQRYGTILIDLETSQVIDLLDDRKADTLSDWLQTHPEIEIVSRDRSSAYAEAITRGAPTAVQVADRWHLLHNLSDIVYLLLQQEAKTIHHQFAVTPKRLHSVPEEPPTAVERPLSNAEQRRKERIVQVEALRQKGWSQKAIAGHLHIHPKTVRRYRNNPSARLERTRKRHLLDAYKPYLLQRWNEGCHNAAQLYREIQPQGFRGHLTIVRDFVQTLRAASGLPARIQKTNGDHKLPADLVPTTPTLRTLTWWILKRPEDRVASEERLLAQITEGQPKLIETVSLARAFTALIREQQEDQLTRWLDRASHSNYILWRNFADGLKQDEKAVRAALRFPWSNGKTEGHVNRLKYVKRLMFGRANDDLLRKRVFWQGKLAFT